MKKILISLLLLTIAYSSSFLRVSQETESNKPVQPQTPDIVQINDHILNWTQNEVFDEIVQQAKDEIIQYAIYENITNFQIDLSQNDIHNIYPLLQGIDAFKTLKVLDIDLSHSQTLDVSTFNYWTFPQSLESFSLDFSNDKINDLRYFLKLIPKSSNLRNLELDFTHIKTENGQISIQPLAQMFEDSVDDIDLTYFKIIFSCKKQCRLRKISGLFDSLRNQQSFEKLYLSFSDVVIESESVGDELIDVIEDLFITKLTFRFEYFTSKQILRFQRVLLQKAQTGELEYLRFSPMGKQASKFFEKKMKELQGENNFFVTQIL